MPIARMANGSATSATRQDRERMRLAASDHSNFSKRSPISPRGRNSSTSTISMYIDASAAGG